MGGTESSSEGGQKNKARATERSPLHMKMKWKTENLLLSKKSPYAGAHRGWDELSQINSGKEYGF